MTGHQPSEREHALRKRLQDMNVQGGRKADPERWDTTMDALRTIMWNPRRNDNGAAVHG